MAFKYPPGSIPKQVQQRLQAELELVRAARRYMEEVLDAGDKPLVAVGLRYMSAGMRFTHWFPIRPEWEPVVPELPAEQPEQNGTEDSTSKPKK